MQLQFREMFPRFPGRPARSGSLYRLAYPGCNGRHHTDREVAHYLPSPPVTSSISGAYTPLSTALPSSRHEDIWGTGGIAPPFLTLTLD
jgi:hypothetical protein